MLLKTANTNPMREFGSISIGSQLRDEGCATLERICLAVNEPNGFAKFIFIYTVLLALLVLSLTRKTNESRY